MDLRANLAVKAQAIRAELPHMRLDAEPSLMSVEEKDQAAKTLRDLLDRLR